MSSHLKEGAASRPSLSADRGRGQVMPLAALFLAFLLIPMVSLAVEASALYAQDLRLRETAMAAAEDAAQQLNVGVFRSQDRATIDPSLAEQAVRRDLEVMDSQATIVAIHMTPKASPTSLTVTLKQTYPVPLAGLWGAPEVVLTTQATARPVVAFAAAAP